MSGDSSTMEPMPLASLSDHARKEALGSSEGAVIVNDAASPQLSDPLDRAVLAQISAILGPSRLTSLLQLLAGELDERRKLLSGALADRDLPRAACEAHSLRGVAANLGAARLAEATRALEQAIAAAGQGDDRGLARGMSALARAAAATRTAVHAFAQVTHRA